MKRCTFILTLLSISLSTGFAQGVGADSIRLRSAAGGSAWLLLSQTSTQPYRLLLPPSLGTANNQLMWVNGTTGQISLLPPGSVGQILQVGAGGLTWVDPSTLTTTTAWSLIGNSGTNPSSNFLGTTDNQPLVVRTNNTERLRITATGNVGIGTTAPGAKLSLGTDQANTKLAIYDGGSDQYGFGIQGSQFRIHLGNSGARFSFLNAPAGTEILTIMGSGNVGIGNTSPSARLHVSGGDVQAEGHVLIRNTDNTARELRLYEPSGAGAEYTAFRAQSQGTNITYTLPATLSPTTSVANGILQTDASGNLSWVSPSALVSTNAWALSGNNITSAWNGTSGSFLGTTNTQPLVIATTNTTTRQPIQFWAGNQQVLQLNPAGSTAPAWSIQRDGGGNQRGYYAVDLQAIRSVASQVASGNYSVIGGGYSNTAYGDRSVVGGGYQNTSMGDYSTIAGGRDNTANGIYSAVGGGQSNNAASQYSTISGGRDNTANGGYSTVGGGQSNNASVQYSTVGGGRNNTASGDYSFVGGGQNNTASGSYSAITGGYNLAVGARSFGFSGQTAVSLTDLSSVSNIAAFVDVDMWLYNVRNQASQLRLYEPSGAGTNYSAFRAQAQASDIIYTLPATLSPTTSVANALLQTDASGNLSWVNSASAVTTFAWSLTGNSGTSPSTNFLGTTDNQPLAIRTNNQERLRILSTGNVGIGTITPLSALDIAGSVAIGSYAGTNAAPANGLIVSGNTGIGIASPQTRLHVDGGTGTATYLKVTNGSTTGTGGSDGLNVGITSSGAAEIRQYENNSLSLYTNNTEYLRMLNTGDIRLFGMAGTSGGKYLSLENNNGVASQLRFEVPDNNTTLGSYTAFQAGNHIGRNYTYTLPIDTPAVGDVLKVISVTNSGSDFFISLAWDTARGTTTTPVNRAGGTGFAPYIAYWVNDSTIAPADYVYWDAVNKRIGLGNFTSSSTPQYMLHLRGSSAVGSGDLFIQKDGGTGARLYFGTPNLGNNWTAFRAGSQSVNLDYILPTTQPTNSGDGTNRFALATDNGNSTSPQLLWRTFWSPAGNAGVTTGFIGTTDANDLRFRTNNTQRMVITSTGNIGIGLAAPTTTLDVNGSANFSNNVTIGGNLTANGSTITFSNIPANSSATELVVWNSGNIERRNATGVVTNLAWSLTGNSGTSPSTNFLGTTDNQPLAIRTNNQERLRIDANGLVGIGTTTPSHLLHVSTSADPLRLEGVQTDNSLDQVLVINSNGVVKRRSLSGIAGSAIFVQKTSNQSVTSSTTYQNDNALVYSASANQVFEFEACMFISGGNGGIKIRINIPSGASMKLYAELKKDDQHHWTYAKLTSSSNEINWGTIDSNIGYARIRGIITMGSSGGNIQVQWAQNSSNATATTVEAGSYLKITPIQ